MSKDLVEKKIQDLEEKKLEFINHGNKLREELIMLQRNVDGCDGAIISFKEILKDIELSMVSLEEAKA